MPVRRLKEKFAAVTRDGLDIYIIVQQNCRNCVTILSINEDDTFSDDKSALVVYSADGSRRFSITPRMNFTFGHQSAVDFYISTEFVIDDNF